MGSQNNAILNPQRGKVGSVLGLLWSGFNLSPRTGLVLGRGETLLPTDSRKEKGLNLDTVSAECFIYSHSWLFIPHLLLKEFEVAKNSTS